MSTIMSMLLDVKILCYASKAIEIVAYISTHVLEGPVQGAAASMFDPHLYTFMWLHLW